MYYIPFILYTIIIFIIEIFHQVSVGDRRITHTYIYIIVLYTIHNIITMYEICNLTL